MENRNLNLLPGHLKPLAEALLKFTRNGEGFCRFGNKLLGERAGGLAPRTVSDQLTALEKLGFIIRTKGHPWKPGQIENLFDDPLHGADRNKRRIYLSGHKDVQHLSPLHMAPDHSTLPHTYEMKYGDVSPGFILREVRHDSRLTVEARLMFCEITLIAGEGNCSAPMAYYAERLGLKAPAQALQLLHDCGHLWIFRKGDVLLYGTIAGLYGNMAQAAAKKDEDQLARLRKIFKTCAAGTNVYAKRSA